MRARLAPLLAIGLLIAGCSALPWPSFPVSDDRPAEGRWLDLRGVVHVHTRASHDSPGSIGEVVAAARGAGVRWVALTEHRSPGRIPPSWGLIEGVLLIPGFEVGAAGGTLLALGVEDPPRRFLDAAATIRAIHAAGGLAFVSHLEQSRLADPVRYADAAPDGVELFNLHARASEVGLQLALGGLFLPARVALSPLYRPAYGSLDRWAQLSSARAIVGGVDAHARFRVLGPLGGTLDRYRDVFRVLTTHVRVRSVSQSEVLEALRIGRSYLAFEGLARIDRFRFERVQGRFEIEAPQASVSLVCDGRSAGASAARRAVFVAPADAKQCHAEAHIDGHLWVVTSSMAVDPR